MINVKMLALRAVVSYFDLSMRIGTSPVAISMTRKVTVAMLTQAGIDARDILHVLEQQDLTRNNGVTSWVGFRDEIMGAIEGNTLTLDSLGEMYGRYREASLSSFMAHIDRMDDLGRRAREQVVEEGDIVFLHNDIN